MSRAWQGVILSCWLAGVSGQSVQVNSASDSKPVDVSGIVINEITGAPIRGAVITLTTRSGLLRHLTGADGRFAWKSVAGPIDLMAEREGFDPSPSPKDRNDNWTSQTLRLEPRGHIHGRVTEPSGEPVPGLLVQLLAIHIDDGLERMTPHAQARTDDRGQYRLWHLSAGRYFLRVLGQSRTAIVVTTPELPNPTVETYPVIYYPNVPRRDAATLIGLAPGLGMEANFSVTPQPSYGLRGAIGNFRPYSRVKMTLLREDGDDVGGRILLNTANGSFRIDDVSPGSYILRAFTEETPTLVAQQPVTVTNQDVTGLNLPLAEPTSVEGTLRLLGDQGALPRLMWVLSNAVSPAVPAISGLSKAIVQDGRFRLKGLWPGPYAVDAEISGYCLASVSSGSQDILSVGMVVGAGPIAPLEVVTTKGCGGVNVKPRNAAAMSSYRAYLVSKDQPWRAPRFVELEETPKTISPVYPGRYRLFVLPDTAEIEFRNPSAWAKLERSAIEVTIRAGANETVEVNVPATKETR